MRRRPCSTASSRACRRRPPPAAGELSPRYTHGWEGKTYYTQLRLDPLPPESADELLQALLGNDASLALLKRLLIERTEGAHSSWKRVCGPWWRPVLVVERRAYRLAKPLVSLQVPATVQAVLAARIDRLPPDEKRLLQAAAVIGTNVPLALLQAIAEVPEEPTHLGLTHLQAAEFLYKTRLFPEIEYTFQARAHPSGGLRESLTGASGAPSMPASSRPSRRSPGTAWPSRWNGWPTMPCGVRCGRRPWHTAGRRGKALGRSAYREAAGSFEQALSALRHLPERRDTLEQAIDLRLALRTALHPSGDAGGILTYLPRPRPSRRPSTMLVGWGRSRCFCHNISTSWAHMIRPSPPDSVPSRSPRPARISSCTRCANRYLGVAYQLQVTIVGPSTAAHRPWRPSRGASA